MIARVGSAAGAPVLGILACVCFVASLSIRIVDPIVPGIARDLSVSPETIALLATAFALPYALGQPLLGPLADAIGKVFVVKVCLAVMSLSLLVSALAPSAEILFGARIVSGLAGGGIIPVALALVGDRVALEQRQVALSRLLTATVLAVIFGATLSGLLADALGWRAVFGLATIVTALALAVFTLRMAPASNVTRPPFRLGGMLTGYREVFANPRARICFTAVFVEGALIFGYLPYIAIVLEQRGAGGLREAGFVLAGFGLGGLLYTSGVNMLLRRTGDMFGLMRLGGVAIGLGFLGIALVGAWWVDALAFVLIGFGFFAIHNSLQTQATELAPAHRGAAVSLHAFFFFLGHAAGAPLYALALGSAGSVATLATVAVTSTILSFMLARLLARS